MTQEHPIIPPPELVQQWESTAYNAALIPYTHHIARCAARWGADQELEACCEHLKRIWSPSDTIDSLRTARRPKSLSKKARALDSLLKCHACIDDDLYNDIKEVIESLPDEQ
jgi:hypothetical protein